MSASKLANGIEARPRIFSIPALPQDKRKAYFNVLPNSRFTRTIKFMFIIYSLFHDAVRNTYCSSIQGLENTDKPFYNEDRQQSKLSV